MRETKAIKSIKREMKWFVSSLADGRYNDPDDFSRAMTRLYGYMQGVLSIFDEQYDRIAELWEDFRTDVYILRGVYKPEAWTRIDGVFEQRL